MKHNRTEKNILTNAKLVITIIPMVLITILIFITLTRNEILSLSEDKLVLETKNCAETIDVWTRQTISELKIYKNIIEQTGCDDEKALKVLQSSCGVSDAYPMGIYMGDENCVYLDGSGWVPDSDFVVTEREWYKEGINHNDLAFGEPYVDAMSGEVCVSATSIVNYKPAKTVMAADIYLNYTSTILESATSGIIENAFIISRKNGIVLTDSNSDMIGANLNDAGTSKLYDNINRLITDGQKGQFRTEDDDQNEYCVFIDKLSTNDWYLVTYMSWNTVLNELHHVESVMFIIAGVLSVILIIVTMRISKEMSTVKNKARTDPLTGLHNRSSFRETVKSSLRAQPFCGILMIMDMDNFKLVNDQLGHPEGDTVLKRFAAMLEEYFNRNKDIVSRLGGDEFAVFVGRNITQAEAEAMLAKFVRLFHENFDKDYPDQKLSVSIGAAYAKGGFDFLYQRADRALYAIKENGKNGFKIDDI